MNKLFALIVVFLILATVAFAEDSMRVEITCDVKDALTIVSGFVGAMNNTDPCYPLKMPDDDQMIQVGTWYSSIFWFSDAACTQTQAGAFAEATLAEFAGANCTFLNYNNTWVPEVMTTTSMFCGTDGGYTKLTEAEMFAVFNATADLVGDLSTPCTLLSMTTQDRSTFSLITTKENCTYSQFVEAVHAAAANAKTKEGVDSTLYCQPQVFDRPIANYGNSFMCNPFEAIPALTAFEGMTKCGVVGAFDASASDVALYIEPIETPCNPIELNNAVSEALKDISTNKCQLTNFGGVAIPTIPVVISMNRDLLTQNAKVNAAKDALIKSSFNTACPIFTSGSANNYEGSNVPGVAYLTPQISTITGCDLPTVKALVADFATSYQETDAGLELTLVAVNGTRIWPDGPYDIVAKCFGTPANITIAMETVNALMAAPCKVVNTWLNDDATIGLLPFNPAQCAQGRFIADFAQGFATAYDQSPNAFCTLTRHGETSLIKTTKSVIKLSLAMATQAITVVPPEVKAVLDNLLLANNVAPPTQVCVLDSYEVDMEKSDITTYYVNANIVSNKACSEAALGEQLELWTANTPVTASVEEYKAPSNTAFSTTASFAVVAAVAAVAFLF